jgi:WD40 repeat protein
MRTSSWTLLLIVSMTTPVGRAADAAGPLTFTHSSRVNGLSFAPDGKTLAVVYDGQPDKGGDVVLWDVAGQQPRATLRGHTAEAACLAFSADGKVLYTGSNDRTVRLWDVATGREVLSFRGHQNGVRALAVAPDGKTAASIGDREGVVKLWDPATGKETRELKVESATSVAFSPDGKQVAAGSKSLVAGIWELAAAGEPAVVKRASEVDEVLSVAFAPDGRFLAVGSEDGTVRLWNVAERKVQTTFQEHVYVLAVAFTPNGKHLASLGLDGTIKLWDVASGKELGKFGKYNTSVVTTIAFSADGRYLAIPDGNHVRLFETSKLLEGKPDK